MAKKNEFNFVEVARLLKGAGLQGNRPIGSDVDSDSDTLAPLHERTQKLLGIVNNPKHNPCNMMFFVMYDIESNKVRRLVAKYLEKAGCTRVQKSIFLADLDAAKYEKIRNDLAEVQAMYENNDSILVVPIAPDYLRSMKLIGKDINLDIIMHAKHTLFF